MKSLTIYFNEKSLQGSLTTADWSMEAEYLFHVLNDLLQLRNDCFIAFIDDSWRASCGDRSLANQFGRLGDRHRTKYQRFLLRVKKIKKDVQVLSEITWQMQTADGLTLAGLDASWCFGISKSHSDWLLSGIPAQLNEIDEFGNLQSTALDVKNITTQGHLSVWTNDIDDWGATVAASSVLDSLKGHSVVMYSAPLEHNPPHVHVLHKNSGATLAKYRIEDGVLECGMPTLDAEMRVWLTTYRGQLLRSWVRCQRGGHPYQLEKPAVPQ